MKLFEESHIEFLAVVHIWQALVEWCLAIPDRIGMAIGQEIVVLDKIGIVGFSELDNIRKVRRSTKRPLGTRDTFNA
jgi:hypothetical protein